MVDLLDWASGGAAPEPVFAFDDDTYGQTPLGSAHEDASHFAKHSSDSFLFSTSSLTASHTPDAHAFLKTFAGADSDALVFARDGGQAQALAKPDGISKQIYKIASQLEAGNLSAFAANDKLQVLAQKAWDPPGVPPLVGDLLLKAAKYAMPDARAGAMADLVEASFNNGGIDSSKLNPVLDRLFKEVTTVAKGEEMDVQALVRVSDVALGFDTSTEAQVRAAFKTGAKLAGDDLVGWAEDGMDALGGAVGMLSTNASTKVYLALADQMANLVTSGKLADYAIGEIKHGDMTVAKAIEFVRDFAALAMDNRGSVDYLSPDGQPSADLSDLKQIDGFRPGDRSDLVMVEVIKDLGGTKAEAALNYVTEHYFREYLGGLGEYGLLMGGKEMVKTINDARQAIEEEVTSIVSEMAAVGSGAAELLQATQEKVGLFSDEFLQGVNLIGSAASIALGDDAPLGLGSIGSVAALVSDPSLDAFTQLGVSVTEEVLDIGNPLEKAELIANVSEIILNQFEVANIVGPFVANVVQGAIDIVQAVSGAITDTIDAAVAIVVEPIVVFGGTVVLHAAENFAGFVEGLATLNWESVAASAEQFGRDFLDDTFAVGAAIGDAVINAVNTVVDAANAIVDAARQAANALQTAFNAIEDGFNYVLGWLFGD